MTKIISVIQLKGGAGKSTVATNLAAMLAERGKTLLIDADSPQYTSECWYVLRGEHGFTDELDLTTCVDENAIAQTLRTAAEMKDVPEYIVVDGPARMERVTRYMMAISDLTIIPVGTAKADLWSTYDIEEIVKAEQAERPELDVRLLFNKFRDVTTSAHEVLGEAKKEISIPIMKAKLSYRVAYSDALGEGLAADETRDARATEEIKALETETLRILRSK